MPRSPATRLSVHRAFVVQFRAETDIPSGRCVGRVEHVVSGQATQFETCTELLAFIERVLLQFQSEAPDETPP